MNAAEPGVPHPALGDSLATLRQIEGVLSDFRDSPAGVEEHVRDLLSAFREMSEARARAELAAKSLLDALAQSELD